MIWVVIAFHVVGFVSSIDAVMSTRTAQGAVAWAVSLNAFPYLAVPAYWVLGRSKFEGYVTARQEGDQEIQHIAKLAVPSHSLRTCCVREPSTQAPQGRERH